MSKNELSISMGDCFDKGLADYVGEMPEFTLDVFLQDGVFKDFPLFSGISAVYRIGKSIGEFAHYKKLIAFINAINNGIADEQKRSDYAYKIKTNEQFQHKELEYILVMIDRYIDTEKPEMLAKLYLAYLDGKILWVEFTMYAEVIDRLLPGDYAFLKDHEEVKTLRNLGCEPLLRLMAQGLVAEKYYTTPFELRSNGNIGFMPNSFKKMENQLREYRWTEFGNKLVEILGNI